MVVKLSSAPSRGKSALGAKKKNWGKGRSEVVVREKEHGCLPHLMHLARSAIISPLQTPGFRTFPGEMHRERGRRFASFGLGGIHSDSSDWG